jgi:adenosylhomocysteine nucleosidase
MTYRKIGLIGAMVEEIALFKEHMSDLAESSNAGISFVEGLFEGKRIVLCKSGVGKVNAAVTTQLLIDKYEVDTVLFTGVAGALDPELSIGDIVVSTECMQHDMDVTALGFPRGTIPFQMSSLFGAAPDLIERAAASARKLFDGQTKLGRVLSGDQFIADRQAVKSLHEELGGSCTEMEGAAVAQVCAMNGIPYVVIRSMSDKADGSAHMNFAEFTLLASEHSYRLVADMIKGMSFSDTD